MACQSDAGGASSNDTQSKVDGTSLEIARPLRREGSLPPPPVPDKSRAGRRSAVEYMDLPAARPGGQVKQGNMDLHAMWSG